MPVRRWEDSRIETIVSDLLRAGVILASALVLAGGLLFLVRQGSASPDYRVFRGEPADLRGVAGVYEDARSLDPRGVIQLGLLILLATPVARVAFTVVAFALQRDRLYAAITLFVLAVLLYSLAFARV